MTRVYLHIGAPKTGTTYLQHRLAANRDTLEEHQVGYPAVRPGDVDHFRPALDLMDMTWRDTINPRGQWRAAVAEARRSAGSAILSHELLSAARPPAIERAAGDLEGTEVHVVYSARDLGRQIPAAWQESIKLGKTWTLRRFVRRLEKRPTMFFWRSQNLADVLQRWGAVVPPERIHLVTVPPPGSDRTLLLRRACEALDISLDWLPEDRTGRSNPSLGVDETAAVRALNKRLKGSGLTRRDHARLVKDLLAEGVLAKRESMRAASLPGDVVARMTELAREWNDWVRASGIDVVGDLDDLIPAPGPATWQDVNRPVPRRVANASADALATAVLEAARLSAEKSAAARVKPALRRLLSR